MSMNDRINARIDPDLKSAAAKVFSHLGITEGEAIRMFYAQVRLHQGLPFQVNIPNEETIAAMKEAEHPENLESYTSFEEWEQSLYEEKDEGQEPSC